MQKPRLMLTIKRTLHPPPLLPTPLQLLQMSHSLMKLPVHLVSSQASPSPLLPLQRFSFHSSFCSMVDREQYKYIDGLPNSHKLTISGLRMNTLYLFSVMSWNDLGQSAYLPDLTRAQTKGRLQTIFKLAPRQRRQRWR